MHVLMRHAMIVGLLLLTPVLARADVPGVDVVIDAWHKAAAAADEEAYFSHLTRDAVFLGTDGTERWTRDEFRRWAHPFFARGRAWTFKRVSRNVFTSADGKVAWFDEALASEHMGPCRGSGVLVLGGDGWKIAQYNLSVPVPNAMLDDLVKRIRRHPAKGEKSIGK